MKTPKRPKAGDLYASRGTEKVMVNIRIKPALKAAAEKAAEEDHRSLTNLIEKLLMDHIRATWTNSK